MSCLAWRIAASCSAVGASSTTTNSVLPNEARWSIARMKSGSVWLGRQAGCVVIGPSSLIELFASCARSQFGDDVELAQMAGIFLDQMQQDPLERRRFAAVPPRAGPADLVEIVGR